MKNIPKNETETDEQHQKLVKKGKILCSLLNSPLKREEFEIIDLCFAEINSHDPENRTVIMDKGKLEKKMGVSRIRTEVLEAWLYNLVSIVIQIDDEPKNGDFIFIKIFTDVCAKKDPVTDQWHVELTCSEAAKEYIFNIENLEYFKHTVHNVFNLKSLYAYKLLLYLEYKRQFTRCIMWEESVEAVKEKLGATELRHNDFWQFKSKVLTPAIEEINSQTETKVSFDTIKHKNKVTHIRFILEPKKKAKCIESEGLEAEVPDSKND